MCLQTFKCLALWNHLWSWNVCSPPVLSDFQKFTVLGFSFLLFRVFHKDTSYETSLMESSSDRDLNARKRSVRLNRWSWRRQSIYVILKISFGLGSIKFLVNVSFFRNHSLLGMFAEVLAALVTFLMEGCGICNVLLSRSCIATLMLSRAWNCEKKWFEGLVNQSSMENCMLTLDFHILFLYAWPNLPVFFGCFDL